MTKKLLLKLLLPAIILLLSGCATVGPSIIRTYNDAYGRESIAILRTDQKAGLTILSCDNSAIPRSARYILLQPGRHEVWFSISGQTILEIYTITNKKYIDVSAGHTYILKSKGGGIFVVGNNWFPEVIDVTDDPSLHIQDLPQEPQSK